eukprot:CAMPEP_0178603390 /NCGR_PEP_ID=MMETSP0697-20121206/35483_1 /TAXON_ID=265572 /ORGANISM="Extubocellulus spinifer, Strain CCMP396" /LENGTH=449 /DNA_ID=CAMNT_0020241687 /DNA_START=224 /DNA_END=1569 /DNA_ORIENTATION=-
MDDDVHTPEEAAAQAKSYLDQEDKRVATFASLQASENSYGARDVFSDTSDTDSDANDPTADVTHQPTTTEREERLFYRACRHVIIRASQSAHTHASISSSICTSSISCHTREESCDESDGASLPPSHTSDAMQCDSRDRSVENGVLVVDSCSAGAYPDSSFVVESESTGGTFCLRGSVLLPGTNVSCRVKCYPLVAEEQWRDILVVMRSLEDEKLHVALCHWKNLPYDVAAALITNRRRLVEWTDITSLQTMARVKRNGEELNLIQATVFNNYTCDDDMASALKKGAVTRRGRSKVYYGVLPRPYPRGRELPPGEVFLLPHTESAAMAMHAPPPSNDISRRILLLGRAALNRLRVEVDSMIQALCLLEEMATVVSAAEPTEHERYLTYVLCGETELPNYGRLVPCHVQSGWYSDIKGLFAACPCSCDIDFSSLDPELAFVLGKIKGTRV